MSLALRSEDVETSDAKSQLFSAFTTLDFTRSILICRLTGLCARF
jgi:hypothetical protein